MIQVIILLANQFLELPHDLQDLLGPNQFKPDFFHKEVPLVPFHGIRSSKVCFFFLPLGRCGDVIAQNASEREDPVWGWIHKFINRGMLGGLFDDLLRKWRGSRIRKLCVIKTNDVRWHGLGEKMVISDWGSPGITVLDLKVLFQYLFVLVFPDAQCHLKHMSFFFWDFMTRRRQCFSAGTKPKIPDRTHSTMTSFFCGSDCIMIFFLGTSRDNIRQAEFTPRTDATPGNWPGIEKCTKASTEKNMIFRTDSHVSTCLKDRELPKMHSIARWCHECDWKLCAAIFDAIMVMGHSENNECAALQRDLQRRTQVTCIVARDTEAAADYFQTGTDAPT